MFSFVWLLVFESHIGRSLLVPSGTFTKVSYQERFNSRSKPSGTKFPL